jgi:hypothetical protein
MFDKYWFAGLVICIKSSYQCLMIINTQQRDTIKAATCNSAAKTSTTFSASLMVQSVQLECTLCYHTIA